MNTHLEEAKRILKDVARRAKVSEEQLPQLVNCQVWFDGDFTVAFVNNTFVGVTKRNRRVDKFNKVTGQCTAITRAVKRFVTTNSR